MTKASVCREQTARSLVSGLLAKNIANKDDLRVAMTAAEFLAKAWKLANDKARELGWIV
jgi:hypothetical protein